MISHLCGKQVTQQDSSPYQGHKLTHILMVGYIYIYIYTWAVWSKPESSLLKPQQRSVSNIILQPDGKMWTRQLSVGPPWTVCFLSGQVQTAQDSFRGPEQPNIVTDFWWLHGSMCRGSTIVQVLLGDQGLMVCKIAFESEFLVPGLFITIIPKNLY